MATATRSVEALGAGPPRPGAGKNWSEVCNRVTHPDGSVRTSAPFKSGGAASSATASSPPQQQKPAACHGLVHRRPSPNRGAGHLRGFPGGGAPSSRGGSSRGGSSGKSSRSSSRERARDGDISSRCSSGLESSTNSSEPSRPHTPPDAVQAPFAPEALKMPDPIRTIPLIPTALLGEEQVSETKPEVISNNTEMLGSTCGDDASVVATDGSVRPGMPLKRDPYGRDRRVEAKGEWSVEPLAKYLKGVVQQIDGNLRDKRIPTAERLDAFVSRLVKITQRQLRHAPKRIRHSLKTLFEQRFRKFWNFSKNEKVTTTTPEELKWVLVNLVEQLVSEYTVNSDMLPC